MAQELRALTTWRQLLQPRVPDAGVSGGTVIPEESVDIDGWVPMPKPVPIPKPDPCNGTVCGGVVRRRTAGTGGPIRDAGAPGSAAAGNPGVCAMAAPANKHADATAHIQPREYMPFWVR